MVAPGVNLQCAVSTSGGSWQVVHTPTMAPLYSSGFRLGPNTFGEKSQTWRRTMVSSPVVQGDFQVTAVQENVTIPFEIYVFGTSQAVLTANIATLIALFTQNTAYKIRVMLDDQFFQYDCDTADYSINSTQQLLLNQMAIFTASVPTRPTVFNETRSDLNITR